MFGRSLGAVGRVSVVFLEIYFDFNSFKSHFRVFLQLGPGLAKNARLERKLPQNSSKKAQMREVSEFVRNYWHLREARA